MIYQPPNTAVYREFALIPHYPSVSKSSQRGLGDKESCFFINKEAALKVAYDSFR